MTSPLPALAVPNEPAAGLTGNFCARQRAARQIVDRRDEVAHQIARHEERRDAPAAPQASEERRASTRRWRRAAATSRGRRLDRIAGLFGVRRERRRRLRCGRRAAATRSGVATAPTTARRRHRWRSARRDPAHLDAWRRLAARRRRLNVLAELVAQRARAVRPGRASACPAASARCGCVHGHCSTAGGQPRTATALRAHEKDTRADAGCLVGRACFRDAADAGCLRGRAASRAYARRTATRCWRRDD